MPKDTLTADAACMPIDRRAALGSLAAAGALLAAPRLAKAAGDDGDVFAAIARVEALRRADRAAGDRVAALNRQIPARPALVDDRELFAAREAWIAERETTKARLGYRAAEEAAGDAVAATYAAAWELLDLRPRTLAGLRALVAVLLDVNFFEVDDDGGEALARLVIESPALGREA